MKLLVIYDQEGNIVALAPAMTTPLKRLASGKKERKVETGYVRSWSECPVSRLVDDQKAAELEVPSEFAKLSLTELHERLMVNVSGERGLVRKSP